MLNILFSAAPKLWHEYCVPLMQAFDKADLQAYLSCDHHPEDVDYIIFAPNGPITDFSPYHQTKAIMSLWAGVETVVDNPTLTQPLCRMVDPSLERGMVEYVVGHSLRHHLGMDAHIKDQDGVWHDTVYPPIAAQRHVTVLGFGALGTACAIALRDLGFQVTGWSRTAKQIDSVRCLYGSGGLKPALRDAQIVIVLLPLTLETTNILNVETLALLAPGAFIINPGRGAMIDDAALLSALDSGHIAHATLDTFREEPLPAQHPYWQHSNVTVTPHIASSTRPDTAAEVIADNIAGHEAGGSLKYLVDRDAGY